MMWYRGQIRDRGNGRQFARITCKASNILLGWEGEGTVSPKLAPRARETLVDLYRQVESYIAKFPTFHSTLEPWDQPGEADVVKRMIAAGNKAGVGPMAAVAGAFADKLLDVILASGVDVCVENGGDVALRCNREKSVLIFPGSKEFEAKTAIKVPPGRWGIASSSGKWGHSHSLGVADMVTVVAADAAVADAFATAIANGVTPGCDPESIIEVFSDAVAIAIIWDQKNWYKGELELSFS